MKRFAQVWSVTVGLVFIVGVSVASAYVLDAKTDSQKLRRDVGKRGAKYIQCLVKAATKCEKKGGTSGVECHLDTGVVDYAGDSVLDPKSKQPGKFQASIAKCDDKYTPDKKGTDYVGIGCPGDCVPPASNGIQRCANMAAYEASVEGTADPAGAKKTLPVLAALIDSACNTNLGGGTNSANPANIDCVTDNAKILTKYTKGLGKCYEKCENDYKDKKGNGGDNDDENCLVTGANDPTFATCVSDALAKAQKKAPLIPQVLAVVLPLVNSALDDANDSLYNRFDPTNPNNSPCGTCGDNTREGTEDCDGTDDAACPGSCNADCTCP